MQIESVDFYYLSMPEVLDIGDGSQDLLLVRVQAGPHVGWGECEASPLTSIAALVAPMSHSACKPVQASVLGQRIDDPSDIARIARTINGKPITAHASAAPVQRNENTMPKYSSSGAPSAPLRPSSSKRK